MTSLWNRACISQLLFFFLEAKQTWPIPFTIGSSGNRGSSDTTVFLISISTPEGIASKIQTYSLVGTGIPDLLKILG